MADTLSAAAMAAPFIALGAGSIITGVICMWIGRKRP